MQGNALGRSRIFLISVPLGVAESYPASNSIQSARLQMPSFQDLKVDLWGGGYRLPVVETTGYKMSPFQGCKRKI